MTPIAWAAIAIAIVIIYGPIQTLLESIARQRLFNMRDRLFDQAANGTASFDSSEYQQARDRLNAAIRFTHSLKWYILLLAQRVQFDDDQDPQDEVEENALYGQFRQEAARTMLWLMVFRSPFLLVTGTAYAVYMIASLKFSELRKRLGSLSKMVERGAGMA